MLDFKLLRKSLLDKTDKGIKLGVMNTRIKAKSGRGVKEY